MSTRADRITELRRHVQDTQGYSVSSKWYTHLSNAINYLKRAETASNHLDAFRDAWAVIYNLFMLRHRPGEEENKALSRWAAASSDIPALRTLAPDDTIHTAARCPSGPRIPAWCRAGN